VVNRDLRTGRQNRIPVEQFFREEEEHLQVKKVTRVAIIPAYNEESSIAKVIVQTKQYVDEVIVCDDGSTDMTATITESLGARVVRHTENQGKGAAIRTLAKEVRKLNPEVIVMLDGDGQHDPKYILLLVTPIETGESDIVVGSRYVDGGKTDAPFYRRVGLRVINFLYTKGAGVSVKDTQSGFRAYSLKAFKSVMGHDTDGYGMDGEQLSIAAKNGLRVMEVPISVSYSGPSPTSKKPPLLHGAALVSSLFRLIVEERPLLYLGVPGIALTGIGMILGLILLWMLNETRYFSIPIATVTLGAYAVGLMLIIAAITLHGLKRITEKVDKIRQYIDQS
jgi:glycosyltransferase involved in cell wall biosynthesis